MKRIYHNSPQRQSDNQTWLKVMISLWISSLGTVYALGKMTQFTIDTKLPVVDFLLCFILPFMCIFLIMPLIMKILDKIFFYLNLGLLDNLLERWGKTCRKVLSFFTI